MTSVGVRDKFFSLEVIHPPEDFHLLPIDKLKNLKYNEYTTGFGGRGYDDHFSITYFEKENGEEIAHMWYFPQFISKIIRSWMNMEGKEKERDVRNKIIDALGLENLIKYAVQNAIEDIEDMEEK